MRSHAYIHNEFNRTTIYSIRYDFPACGGAFAEADDCVLDWRYSVVNNRTAGAPLSGCAFFRCH